MLRPLIAVAACAQVAVAFNIGGAVPSLGLRNQALSGQRLERSPVLLGSKRAAPLALRAAVDAVPETKKEQKQGRGVLKARPIGVGHAAPSISIPNKDMENIVETTDEWIQTRTGIENRHVLSGKETLRDLAIEAGKAAIKDAGIKAEDIDLVIVATSSPDDMFGDAPSVATGCGVSKSAFAFDLTAACSGFLFGTVTASQFLNNGGHKTALVVGADALTRWVDWTDRNSCVLFGDGAGAMVLTSTEAAEEGGILGFEMHSDGNGYCNLNLPYQQRDKDIGPVHKVLEGEYTAIGMNGKEVYTFATRQV
jgi:3-oxoacyl-[acyl-carrier-protein] synthase-3